jgi:hypothetical protein
MNFLSGHKALNKEKNSISGMIFRHISNKDRMTGESPLDEHITDSDGKRILYGLKLFGQRC